MTIIQHKLVKPRASAHAGFNLIEVMLAVAIVGLALVAVLGMLPIGINASRQVGDDTVVSQLVADMIHWRRIAPFDKPTRFITELIPGADDSLTTPRPKTLPATVGDLDFDANSYSKNDTLYTDVNSSFYNKFTPYFRVTYVVQDQPQFSGPPPSPDIAQVVITVVWPVFAAPANQQRRVYISNFARIP